MASSTVPSNVYQFKITLKGAKPPIWRRIEVPQAYTFADLHNAIQDAMGWADCHLHDFNAKNPMTGMKEIIGPELEDDFGFGMETVPETKAKISNYFLNPSKDRVTYTYDMGDGWTHDVRLEAINPALPGLEYPKCLAGKRACPPEDCGGIYGYEELLKIRQDPKHPEYEERIVEWLNDLKGEDFDPAAFDPLQVSFCPFR